MFVHVPSPVSSLSDLMTSQETAAFLNVPPGTLRSWRHYGMGPRAFRLGPRKIMYRHSDVLAWLDAQYEAERTA